jgi:hypothetical protein
MKPCPVVLVGEPEGATWACMIRPRPRGRGVWDLAPGWLRPLFTHIANFYMKSLTYFNAI